MLSPTMGFSILHNKSLKTTPRTTLLLLRQDKITWSDYKHDFIDPIAAHATDTTNKLEHWLEGRMDPRKRDTSAYGYWLEKFEADKEKLQNMNQAASSTPETSIPPPTSTWDQYAHKYIDPILRKKTDSTINLQHDEGESWSKTAALEDKQKLQNMNQATSSTPETTIPPGLPIWDQYNHNYIDTISLHKAHTRNLHGQEMDPATSGASADEFWFQTVMEEEKERLLNMNQAASSTPGTSIPPPASTWDQYTHKYIDPISRQKTDIPETPASADEIWSNNAVLEEKQKLQNMNPAASSTPETSTPPGFPIWDQYNHKYIDSVSSPQKTHHANLHDHRMDPETRTSADEFWYKTAILFFDEKTNLRPKKMP
jgi:hypothetical protein